MFIRPFGVMQVAIHLTICPFFFSSVVLLSYHLFPSQILCLWLSLDFSQIDKLISFIHTWSFSLLSPCLHSPHPHPTRHPSSFHLAGHRALLYENSLDLKGRSEVVGKEGGGGGGVHPALQVRLPCASCLSLRKPGISSWHPISY